VRRSWRAALALTVVMPFAGSVQAQATARPARASPPVRVEPPAAAGPASAEPGRRPDATGDAARATSGTDPLVPAAHEDGKPGQTGISAPLWQSGATTPVTEEPVEVGYKGRCGG